MKININQKMYNESGDFFQPRGRSEYYLMDAILSAILVPLQDDDEKKKFQKYDIFKKCAKEAKNGIVELSSEEVTMIKNAAGKVLSPLLYGQVVDMLEDKFDAEAFESLKSYYAAMAPKEEKKLQTV